MIGIVSTSPLFLEILLLSRSLIQHLIGHKIALSQSHLKVHVVKIRRKLFQDNALKSRTILCIQHKFFQLFCEFPVCILMLTMAVELPEKPQKVNKT